MLSSVAVPIPGESTSLELQLPGLNLPELPIIFSGAPPDDNSAIQGIRMNVYALFYSYCMFIQMLIYLVC